MKIFHRQQLQKIQNWNALLKSIEAGFAAYSQGQVVMPPVSHMHFQHPPGDVHIKCASMNHEEFYVVKIASCFPGNSKQGLASVQGMLVLFRRNSGEPEAIFLDGGYLTHLRTALAGAICAKYLAPKEPQAIGIIGAGMQARFQLQQLASVTTCRQVWVWAPTLAGAEAFQSEESLSDFDIHIAAAPQEVAEKCRLIVTTTPSTSPLLFAQDIAKGTHITAVGSDRPGKQELDPAILQMADRVIVDSRAQCMHYGETSYAIGTGMISKENVDEIGEIISGVKPARCNEQEITVADLTGLGIQDLMIALECLKSMSS